MSRLEKAIERIGSGGDMRQETLRVLCEIADYLENMTKPKEELINWLKPVKEETEPVKEEPLPDTYKRQYPKKKRKA